MKITLVVKIFNSFCYSIILNYNICILIYINDLSIFLPSNYIKNKSKPNLYNRHILKVISVPFLKIANSKFSQSPCFKKRIFPSLHHRSKLHQRINFSYRTNLQYSITNFIVNSNFHQRILFYYISIVYSAVYPNFVLFKLSSTHIILLHLHSL